jgi:hypothetical protein
MAAQPQELARFYSRLLSWPYIREEGPHPGEPPEAGYALVCPPEGAYVGKPGFCSVPAP